VEQRVAWDDLPGPLKQAIEVRTGPIESVRVASAGQNSPLAAVIDARDGKVFAKGLPSTHRRVITQAREAAVAPLVKEISPALLWHFDESGWNVLGYQYAPGRHADYSPGSPDLDRLVHLMDALSAIKVPDDPGPLKRAEDRWIPYLDDPDTATVFAGPVLTHSDWTPDNVLVSEQRTWLIDWAWPTLGAAWTDPACWVLRLMASGGHTAHEAERQASRLPAFKATRRTSTCSPPPTSGYGTRSRSRTQATGQPRWHRPRNHGLPTARLAEPSERRVGLVPLA
jgi:hypothetical protein